MSNTRRVKVVKCDHDQQRWVMTMDGGGYWQCVTTAGCEHTEPDNTGHNGG